MAVITISREFACGGKVFAQNLAERLGYSVLEKELVAHVAEALNISPSEAMLFEKERDSRLLRFMDKYTSNTVRRILDRPAGRLDDKSYYEATADLVKKVAQEGDAIILGWGSQCILQGHPGAFHLRIVRDLKDRIAFATESSRVDEAGALDLIERQDIEKAAYVQRYFNCSWDNAHLYHMVLNLSRFSMEQALNIVADCALRHHT